jgi:hypothetical protein
VTAGGVAWDGVDARSMGSKIVPGLFFAGELLDVDGVTGGHNFQSCWTTGMVAGRAAHAHAEELRGCAIGAGRKTRNARGGRAARCGRGTGGGEE